MEDLINKLINYVSFSSSENINFLRFLFNLIISSFLGVLISLVHSKFTYVWLRSKAFLYIAAILPPIGLTITVVISSNIALSLGMIGALSIIRFRTPVRSSYELIYYFALLTIGISINVSFLVTIALFVSTIVIPILINFVFKNFTNFSNIENVKESIFELIIPQELIKELLDQKSTISLYSKIFENNQNEVRLVKKFENSEEEAIFLKKWEKFIKNYEINKN